jgi:putative transposase
MPRLPRPIDDGLIYHAINRGNNRHDVFGDERDFAAFLAALAQTQKHYPFRLFGYCLMMNPFHLPAAARRRPVDLSHSAVADRRAPVAVPSPARSVGRLCQGRFKSPMIQDDYPLLVVPRYIDANSLRAGMGSDAGADRWSSYAAHRLAGHRQVYG